MEHNLEWQGKGKQVWARCSCGKPFDAKYTLDVRATILEDFERHVEYQRTLEDPEDCPGCGMPMDKLSHGWGPCS